MQCRSVKHKLVTHLHPIQTEPFKLAPLVQVCPPGLHITLGIFYRLWCLLEAGCHELDLELATRISPTPTDRDSFLRFSSLTKELAQLSQKRNDLRQLTTTLTSVLGDLAIQIANAETHPLVQALRTEARSAALKLDEVVCINTH